MWVQNASGLATCYHAAKSMNDYLKNTEIGFPKVPDQLKNKSSYQTSTREAQCLKRGTCKLYNPNTKSINLLRLSRN